MFKCSNKNCAIHSKGSIMPVFMNCPLCDTPLESNLLMTSFQLYVKESYPYVIAFPFIRMLQDPPGRNKLELMSYSLVNILKYIGLITASEYYHSPLKSNKLNDLFKNNLFQPSIGNWNQFIREAVKELKALNHEWIFPELLYSYEQIETGPSVKKYQTEYEVTNQEGESEWIKTSDTAIGTLINFRNKHLGHGAPHSDNAVYDTLYHQYYPILESLLKGIEPIAKITMYKSDQKNVYKLSGFTVSKVDNINSFPFESIWIQDDIRKLNLLPFFVLPSSFANVKENPQVFVYEQNTTSRVVFFSPESKKAESLGTVFELFKYTIAEKEREKPLSLNEIQVDKLLNRIDLHNSRLRNGLLKESKVIDGVYQNREKEEGVLKIWQALPYGLLFINAEAGAGKTNLLYFINTYYRSQGLSSMFIRANQMNGTNLEVEIKKNLNIEESISFNEIIQLYSAEKSLMIIIDGGNEHPDPDGLLEGVKDFLLRYCGGALKIILSWRNALGSTLPILNGIEDVLFKVYNHQEKLDFNSDSIQLPNFSLGINNAQCDQHPLIAYGMKIAPMNRLELESTWNKYTSYRNEKNKKYYCPDFTLKELEINDRLILNQLSNPLMLRMFLEYFNNKSLKHKGKGISKVESIWWDMISKNKSQVSFLTSLAGILAQNDTLAIELDILYDHPLLGVEFQQIQSNSPYRKLLDKGEITCFFKNEKLMVGFVMEKKFFYTLSQILNIEQVDKQKVKELINRGEKWKAALSHYLIHQINKNEFGLLFDLVDDEEVSAVILSEPIAQALLTQDIDSFLDGLLKKPTKRDWEILDNGIAYLKYTGKHERILVISDKVFYKASSFENYPIELCISLEPYLKGVQKKQHYKELERLEINHIIHPETLQIIAISFHNKGNDEKALEFYDKCEDLLTGKTDLESILALNDLNKAIIYANLFNQNLVTDKSRLQEKCQYYLHRAEKYFKLKLNKGRADNYIVVQTTYVRYLKSLIDLNTEADEKRRIYHDIKNKIEIIYQLYKTYVGEDKILLMRIMEMEANSIKEINPNKAILIFKEVVALKKQVYGTKADLKNLYVDVANLSKIKKDSFQYFKLYQRESMREIIREKSFKLLMDYFWFSHWFYIRRVKFSVRWFYYCYLAYAFRFSYNKRWWYAFFLFFIILILMICLTPIMLIMLFKFPKIEFEKES